MSKNTYETLRAKSGLHQIGLATVLALAALSGPLAQAQGMRVTRDPVTGLIRVPTPEENKALDDQRAADALKAAAQTGQPAPLVVAPVPVVRADGSVQLKLGEEFMTYSVMVRNADGTMSMQCVTGESSASNMVFGKAASAANQKGNPNE